ncbi:hypothetical protein EXN66_Car018904 [Channa argus]|uniref:Uncharacterized protein n=1 Tax=Channa argus TaxID=215402 RepID=A0A6G1QM99_CHAAH|nr:hypothetical protein EXN66_Car018904 [Channa argus]
MFFLSPLKWILTVTTETPVTLRWMDKSMACTSSCQLFSEASLSSNKKRELFREVGQLSTCKDHLPSSG